MHTKTPAEISGSSLFVTNDGVETVIPTGATKLLRSRGSQQTGFTRLVPEVTVNLALLGPALCMG